MREGNPETSLERSVEDSGSLARGGQARLIALRNNPAIASTARFRPRTPHGVPARRNQGCPGTRCAREAISASIQGSSVQRLITSCSGLAAWGPQ